MSTEGHLISKSESTTLYLLRGGPLFLHVLGKLKLPLEPGHLLEIPLREYLGCQATSSPLTQPASLPGIQIPESLGSEDWHPELHP